MDRYIEGLYSYPVPGTRMDYHRIISEPIDGRIYFIGEYVHPVYTQSMLGACESAL
jgi:monoamine oxidase